MRIVVRIPNWIGDTILALPALDSLKQNFPEAQVWIAASQWVKDLFAPDDFVEGTISLPNLNDLKNLRHTAQKLKEFDFDIGLVLTNSFSSALLFFLAKIPQRWGYASDGRRLLLTRGVPVKNQEATCHQANYYLDLLSGLALRTTPPEIKLFLSLQEKEDARKVILSMGLDLTKPLIILAPGAHYGPAKRWPASRFAQLATLFQTKNAAEILIVGSPHEIGLSEHIASFMERKPQSLAGKTTLRQLLSIISHATLFVTNDSGPMHMANALRVPLIALFGPTDPRVTGPLHQPATVIKKEVPCWPCSYRKCPYDHRCLMKIGVEEVFLASQNFLR